jgi:hypothetical protein
MSTASYISKRLTSRVATGPRRIALWSVLAGVAIAVAHVPSFVHRLLDGDEAIYGSIAVLMNMGGGLYAEGGVDNKPPGIFWVYALTFRCSARNTEAVHIVARHSRGDCADLPDRTRPRGTSRSPALGRNSGPPNVRCRQSRDQ